MQSLTYAPGMTDISNMNLSSVGKAAGVEPLYQLLPEAISRLTPEVRYRAENALDGFARAKMLLSIDREMASFRAITAAEEAASALIRSLQLRAYPNVSLIDLRKHAHKAAVPFFLRAVHYELTSDQKKFDLTIQLSADPPKLTVGLPLRQFVELSDDSEDVHLVFVDPLGVIGSKGGVAEINYFDAAVQKVAGSRKVDKLIASEANGRNRILYAHDTGLPRSQVTLESITQRERSANLCLLLAIAVLQVEHHQAFALQCLMGFLKVIRRSDIA